MSLDDIELEDLIDQESEGGELDPMNMSPRELEQEVLMLGPIPLDDQGRLLVKCPCYSDDSICGLYPAPDEHGDVEIHCTGPLNSGRSASSGCRYQPDLKYPQPNRYNHR